MKTNDGIEQIIERGCGLDVHKDNVVVSIRGKGIKPQTRTFSTYTRSLISMRDWLLKNGITHGMIESTGVYWKPVYNILDGHITVMLVNPRHLKNVPGRKTDKIDSQWLAKLLLFGLLNASFIPNREIRDLRDLVRYKKKLTKQLTADSNRMIKILEDANIKISSVFSETLGSSSMKIIDEIIAGDYQPERLLHHIHGNVKKSRAEIKEAITGNVTSHHRFMLETIRKNIKHTEDMISEMNEKIYKETEKYGLEIDLLNSIPGVDKDGAIGIISEIGVDMSHFPDQKHLASWAGMSPGANESAGKKKSGKTTHGNHYLRALLSQLAWAASRTKGTYLKSKYYSLVGRRGNKKAIIAVGHKILIASYFIIKDKVEFNELGENHLTNYRKDKLIAYHKKQLSQLEPNLEFDNKRTA
jgi:transposase